MDSLLVFWNGIFKWLHNVAEVLWCQAKARIWITGKCLHNPEKWLETTTNYQGICSTSGAAEDAALQ
jgi:hypothetical protein